MLDERALRRFVVAEAQAAGFGGIAAVSRITCVVCSTIGRGLAVLYGISNIAEDTGWVNIGIDRDTATFAVNAIKNWWTQMGRRWRQLQRLARAFVEGPTAKACRRTRPHHHRVSLATRDKQVEQDRAPPVLIHHSRTGGASRSSVIR